jgi:hypothetical protein
VILGYSFSERVRSVFRSVRNATCPWALKAKYW